MKIQPLTPAEESLMETVWKLQSGYLKDIVEQHPEPKPHQNTISTYLKILTEKEFISAEKEGRIFRYTTLIPYEDYRKFQLRTFTENYFGGSGKELLKSLLDEKFISPTDFEDFVEIKTRVVALPQNTDAEEAPNPITEFIEELTSDKKKKDKKKKKQKKNKKKDKKNK